jgi:hypothetical protein
MEQESNLTDSEDCWDLQKSLLTGLYSNQGYVLAEWMTLLC